MFRTAASFALATLSLFTSYAILAAWPDHPIPREIAVAAQAPPTIVGLAD